ncbi:Phosphoglycolate phosphatase 2 [Platanthera guangdongensis]|uniref:Phosphoglycolate phosphatase 2 n=1 Tax=Platanthera guangdongensis TaxID=2320717 RepID=A0ABR2LH00_9ASPA
MAEEKLENGPKITEPEVAAATEDGKIIDSGAGKGSTHRELTSDGAADLIRSIDAFLLDCDGVIWKGDKLIDGVPEALRALRSMGKRLVFVTNNSTKSRRQYARKFTSLGLDVNEDEIFSSSFASAMFLKLNNFPPDKKIYVIGEEGILEELELAGFTGIGGPEDGKKTIQLKSNLLFEHDKNVGAVIVGLDQYINYYKLQYATLCIRENPGCLFIATNRDAVGHLTDLQEWPGAGCMVAAVCGAVQKEPVVVGKPSTFLMDFLLERHQIDVSKMCMVGDRLDTDILFGKNAGCRTLLVLSGVTTLSELNDSSNSICPDYYTNNFSDIVLLSRK